MTVGLFASTGQATRVQANEELVSGQAQEKIIGTFVMFYQEIPDEPRERYAGVWKLSRGIIDAAESVLAQVPAIDEVADLKDFGELIVGLLRNITENLAAVYDIHIETKYLDKAVRSAGYLPLLAQIWSLLQASIRISDIADTKQRFVQEALHTDAGKTAVKRFYISILLLFTELVSCGVVLDIGRHLGPLDMLQTLVSSVSGDELVSEHTRPSQHRALACPWFIRNYCKLHRRENRRSLPDLSLSSINFSPLSAEEISKALPRKTSSPLPPLDISEYLPFNTQVESAANSVGDSSTKTVLIERYGGSGIIEAKNTEADGSDWIFW